MTEGSAEPGRAEVESVAKFAELKSRQFREQAFGDSRVEDAANVLEDVALMLRAALHAATAPQEGWQPIETAPKDGRQLLLYGVGWAAMGSWRDDRWWTHAAWIGARPLLDGYRSVPPTGWMPLPAAPQVAQP